MKAIDYKGYIGWKFLNVHKLIDENPDATVMVVDPSYGLIEMKEDAVVVADQFKIQNVLHIRSYYDKEKKRPFEYTTKETENATWVENREIIRKEKCLVLFG